MLGPAAEEESTAAGGGSRTERGASPGVPVVVRTGRRPTGHQRTVGGAGGSGGVDQLFGGARPLDAGAEGSARLLRGRDRRDYGNQCEHSKGKAVPGAAEDHGTAAKTERGETSGVDRDKYTERQGQS